MGDGVVVWAGCAAGQSLRQAMCREGRSASLAIGGRFEDCDLDAAWNQTLAFPTAINLFKIQSSRIDEFKEMLSNWRSTQHFPQMFSELVLSRFWGFDGQVISNVVPCSQIPDKFKYKNLADCDELGSSRTLADEAFEVWSGLCSIMTAAQ